MQKYIINKGFIAQGVATKSLIFDPETSLLHTFNGSASFIFQLLKKGLDEKKIIEELVKKFGISKNRAEKDVSEFLSDLKKKKIISTGKQKKGKK